MSAKPSTSGHDEPTLKTELHLQGKRVAMVLFSYYPSDPRPRRAAEALTAEGMRVEMICLRENPHDPKHDTLNGVDIRRVPIARRRGGMLGYLYQYLAFLLASSGIIIFRLLSRRYDLVYVHNMPDFLVLSGVIPKLFGAKVILDLHDPMPELMQTIFNLPETAKGVRLLKRVEKWSLSLADSVVTVNRACAKLFASRSCAAEKISVVMNSPDEEIFRSRSEGSFVKPIGRKRFVVMYHGSLVERNGLALAVEALVKLRASVPSAELRIYGSRNAFLDRVMETVRARKLEDSIRYFGPKSLDEIVRAIEACDVGVIPNLRSIFTELNTPTRIFEYLALGKPVIAPRAPGITDYFDETSLVFFELGDVEDLTRQLEYVFRNPDEVGDITRRGQQIHLAHTWHAERSGLTAVAANLLTGRTAEASPAVGSTPGSKQKSTQS